MLTQVADGVLVHTSPLLQNNTVVVQGAAGVLVVDAGITGAEMACLARDLGELDRPVVAGFSTHPDWDHVLWHPALGEPPRYATAGGASFMQDFRSRPDWQVQAAEGLPPEIADEVPLELFGLLTGLPAGTTHLPWDGPRVRVVEHPAHSVGHAALLVEEPGVLVAGDMLSDIFFPFLDTDAADPVEDYLTGLQRLEEVAGEVRVVVPGHGSVGGVGETGARIALDREHVLALRDGRVPEDPRVGPAATYGRDWLPQMNEWQAQQVAAGRRA